MDDLEVYVVRVYRKDNAGLAGVVEHVAGSQEKSFRGAVELWQALAAFLSLDASYELRSNRENEQ